MVKGKKKSPLVTRNQLLIVALIIVLVLNTLSHFSQPAYKYYKELSAYLFNKQVDFEKQVREEIVPAIYLVISNRVESVTTVTTNTLTTVSESSVITSDKLPLKALDFRYYHIDNSPQFEYQGHYYHIGDTLLFERILDISPTAVMTTKTLYIVPELFEKDKMK